MYVWLSSILFAVSGLVFGLLGSYKLWRFIRYKVLITANSIVEKTFKNADIVVNGNRPWDIKVNNKKLLKRAIGAMFAINRAGTNHILILSI